MTDNDRPCDSELPESGPEIIKMADDDPRILFHNAMGRGGGNDNSRATFFVETWRIWVAGLGMWGLVAGAILLVLWSAR